MFLYAATIFLSAFLLFEVSENTIRSETQALGAVQEKRETGMCQQSQDLDCLQARLRDRTPLSHRRNPVGESMRWPLHRLTQNCTRWQTLIKSSMHQPG